MRDEIKKYYASEIEKDRLDQDHFKLEGIRTQQIIRRYLSQAPLNIIDVGGGTGFYAFWLLSLGHEVSLVDLSSRNIELAKDYANKNAAPLKACETGDATHLDFPDAAFDIVLMLGPLYHLINTEDRVKAISEAGRVLKTGGFLIAAIISRYASLMDGLRRDLIKDKAFVQILVNDLETGIHINTTNNPEYFTTAFFHTPAEIKNEIAASGLQLEKLVAVEGAGWMIDGIREKLKDEAYTATLMDVLDRVESNDDVIAMSPHIIAIAKKGS